MWLHALYPWTFQPAFFKDSRKAAVALRAALSYPHAQTLDAMAHQVAALGTFRPTVRPKDLTCPTLVLFAEHDLMIPEAEGRAVFEHVADVEQHTVPGAGHSVHWDAPDAVAEHLIAFLGRHPTKATA